MCVFTLYYANRLASRPSATYIPGMKGNPIRKKPAPWFVYALVAAAVAGLILFLVSEFPDARENDWSAPRLVYLVLLLLVVGGSAFLGFRTRAGEMIRHALVWTAIGALAILAYSFRGEFKDAGHRIYGELRPDSALVTGDGNVAIRRGSNGHFNITADVEGAAIRFLVDTGASTVALTARDARAIGIDLDRLRYGIPVNTAGGIARAAPVRLSSLAVGNIRVHDVGAVVIRDGLRQSLLGLSFLDRLSGYEVSRNTMILKP